MFRKSPRRGKTHEDSSGLGSTQALLTLCCPESLHSAGVAQLAEHRFCKPDVVGSTPTASSNKKEEMIRCAYTAVQNMPAKQKDLVASPVVPGAAAIYNGTATAPQRIDAAL